MTGHEHCCGTGDPRPAPTGRGRADEPIESAGPISTVILDLAHRVRFRFHDDLVERRAQQLHARSSYDCWSGLGEVDQELWRHMARLDLTNRAPS